MLSVMDTKSFRILYQGYAFNGYNYAEPTAASYVVSKVISTAGLDNQARNKREYGFTYNTQAGMEGEFNNQTLGLQMEQAQVFQSGVGGERYRFFLDSPRQSFLGMREFIFGNPMETQTLKADGGQLSRSIFTFASPYTRTASPRPWPSALKLQRLIATENRSTDPLGRDFISKQSLLFYHDPTSQPQYALREIRPNADYILEQVLFGPNNLPRQEITYRLPSKPVPTQASAPFSNLNATRSTKRVFDANLRQVEASLWRDVDESMTGAQFSGDFNPSFNLNEG